MTPAPLLLISDAVSASSGLGRIARELAVRIDTHLKDVCRIATMGYGGPGSSQYPFPQYPMEGMKDWVLPTLPFVWKDWAGDQPGVILAIWDASRLGWFSRPQVMCEDQALKAFLTSAPIERWIYAPLDADGPHGRLSFPHLQALLGFDRVLAYGRWAEGVIRASLGEEAAQGRDLSSLPHGIDTAIFYPRDRSSSRGQFFSLTGATMLRGQRTAILEGEPLIGTVATNQARKDWGLWAESCALFLARHPQARFWIHTDTLEGSWSLPQLIVDFGLLDRTVISYDHLEDTKIAQAYSACDLTLGIGAGEGFGFPLAESLACGTPVIHVNYAGGAEVVGDQALLVEPVAYRYEGLYCCRRPVVNAGAMGDRMEEWLGKRAALGPEYDWNTLWPRWEAWLRKGLKR